MSTTTTRNRQRAAQRKIAASRQAARRAQRRRMLLAGGSIAAVLAIVISLVLVKALGTPPQAQTEPAAGAALPASVAASIGSVPASTLGAVGTGTTFPHTVAPAAGAPLTAGGKPEVLYVGAEFCPYCATERWPLAVALSRFGTFTGLRGIHSSATDVYPSQPTLTFVNSRYTSKYLTFASVETTTENPNTLLQRPTAAEQALLNTYDAPPYVQPDSSGAIPFIDIGNRYLIHGAQYNPQVLQNHTWAQAAAALHDPASPIAQGADGAANMITAAICKMTGNQPAQVCASPVITHLQGQL
jgi:thiol-disulfide isomerase/thioredoxin